MKVDNNDLLAFFIYDFYYEFYSILGALVAGIIIGAIPAISGAKKGKIGLAIGGFLACVVSSLISGALLAIPVCAVFLFFIFKKGKNDKDAIDQ